MSAAPVELRDLGHVHAALTGPQRVRRAVRVIPVAGRERLVLRELPGDFARELGRRVDHRHVDAADDAPYRVALERVDEGSVVAVYRTAVGEQGIGPGVDDALPRFEVMRVGCERHDYLVAVRMRLAPQIAVLDVVDEPRSRARAEEEIPRETCSAARHV